MRDPLHASSDLEELPVYDAAQLPIGATFGVLAEAASGLVRYFDVAIEGRGRHVLIPVGHARLETQRGLLRVRLRAATIDELEQIPAYEPHVDWSDDAFQDELLTAYGRMFHGQRYYAHPAYDHSGLYAGTNPLLRDALEPVRPGGLCRLSDAPEFRISEGEADVRGWPVLGFHDAAIGTVTELIIDTAAELVRYAVIRRATDNAETVLPVGYLDLRDRAVHAQLDAHDLEQLPVLRAGAFDRDYEARLRVALDGVQSGERRYERPDFRA